MQKGLITHKTQNELLISLCRVPHAPLINKSITQVNHGHYEEKTRDAK